MKEGARWNWNKNWKYKQHIWRFDASGTYSAKSTYRAFFYGSVTFEPWRRLWKSWAPGTCKFFIWLAIINRCWTADRLDHRGLSHPERCPLCDQEEETIQHLLTNCVFSRQIWSSILSPMEMDEKQYHNRMNIALLIGGPSAFVESRRSTKKGLIC